jgi:sugar lactone lactonase YvrE
VTGSASASVEVFADLHADVGEAPHWDEKSKTLLFVDLTAGAVFRYDELGVIVVSFRRPRGRCGRAPAGWRARSCGARRHCRGLRYWGWLQACRAGRARYPRQPDERREVRPCWATPGRDDGVDFTRYSAALYRVESDWSFEQMVRDVTQSNGIAWSPDGKKMYFIDSATQGVDVFDYEAGTGSARYRRRLVTIERAHGVPDGMTTDSQGNLWVTCFGGAAVRCFSPEGEQRGGGVLSGSPGNQLRFRGPRAVGPVCDLCRLSVDSFWWIGRGSRWPRSNALFGDY